MILPGAPSSCFLWKTTLVPGGVIGLRLKSKLPKIYAWAESLVLTRDACKRLIVITACGNSRSHSLIGNPGSQVASPDKNGFKSVNRTFRRVALVHVWWGKLKGFVVLGESCSNLANTFIVKNEVLCGMAVLGEIGVEKIPHVYNGFSLLIF